MTGSRDSVRDFVRVEQAKKSEPPQPRRRTYTVMEEAKVRSNINKHVLLYKHEQWDQLLDIPLRDSARIDSLIWEKYLDRAHEALTQAASLPRHQVHKDIVHGTCEAYVDDAGVLVILTHARPQRMKTAFRPGQGRGPVEKLDEAKTALLIDTQPRVAAAIRYLLKPDKRAPLEQHTEERWRGPD